MRERDDYVFAEADTAYFCTDCCCLVSSADHDCTRDDEEDAGDPWDLDDTEEADAEA